MPWVALEFIGVLPNHNLSQSSLSKTLTHITFWLASRPIEIMVLLSSARTLV